MMLLLVCALYRACIGSCRLHNMHLPSSALHFFREGRPPISSYPTHCTVLEVKHSKSPVPHSDATATASHGQLKSITLLRFQYLSPEPFQMPNNSPAAFTASPITVIDTLIKPIR
ncbi:hypothetical protein BDV32DRAFT_120041 [Aspergillus pseudonomiae]|uniref:Uncharacterized protein n=1 Tax=Aspergillus pseudonomiae TaxID=1506151 RepID=A0A5N6I9P8_9EURO|nr:uncharacterized protein BDV37DRAFT_81662 [Aspergillus pseudonomiae]KAB8262767.1 hypothetical protein BDV32DRAFT_120041 [Aspergillus pseudonomiae]KAE8409687.1 hypothetical protein BDV37DRAFT_81662 [Aspergillus pseudonomiae]